MSTKTKARQIAIQGVYNILLMAKQPEDMGVFLEELIASASAKQSIEVNKKFCRMLLDGVFFRLADLEAVLEKHCKSKPHSPLVKAILLCAAFEIVVMVETSAKVIISEYMAQAELYFDTPERPFIHAVLDAIQKDVRGA